MSTLNEDSYSAMEQQIKNANGKLVPKDKVLSILHKKLIEIDEHNPFIVDRIDGAAVKGLINEINRI